MSRLAVGLICGLIFGAVDVALMLPMSFPDKRTALLAAFLSRFGIGLVIPLVNLPTWPGWLVGVTFEGVGRMLDPDLDVAGISRRHVARIFKQQFNPRTLTRQILRGSPEMVDMAVRLPQLLSAGFKFAEEQLNDRSPSPLAGLRSSVLAAACIVGGVIGVVQHAPSPLWAGLFALAVLLSLFGK